jgi:hypothetical protein
LASTLQGIIDRHQPPTFYLSLAGNKISFTPPPLPAGYDASKTDLVFIISLDDWGESAICDAKFEGGRASDSSYWRTYVPSDRPDLAPKILLGARRSGAFHVVVKMSYVFKDSHLIIGDDPDVRSSIIVNLVSE